MFFNNRHEADLVFGQLPGIYFSVFCSNKFDACLKMLEKLEAKGLLQLPAKRKIAKPKRTKIVLTSKTDHESVINSLIGGFSNINLQIVSDRKEIRLWNEYVFRSHYFGYSQPFGYVMRYFIKDDAQTAMSISKEFCRKALPWTVL